MSQDKHKKRFWKLLLVNVPVVLSACVAYCYFVPEGYSATISPFNTENSIILPKTVIEEVIEYIQAGNGEIARHKQANWVYYSLKLENDKAGIECTDILEKIKVSVQIQRICHLV